MYHADTLRNMLAIAAKQLKKGKEFENTEQGIYFSLKHRFVLKDNISIPNDLHIALQKKQIEVRHLPKDFKELYHDIIIVHPTVHIIHPLIMQPSRFVISERTVAVCVMNAAFIVQLHVVPLPDFNSFFNQPVETHFRRSWPVRGVQYELFLSRCAGRVRLPKMSLKIRK